MSDQSVPRIKSVTQCIDELHLIGIFDGSSIDENAS